MDVTIRNMLDTDWNAVAEIFQQGADTGNGIFEEKIPEWKDWNDAHLKICRFAATIEGKVVGWAALSEISKRHVFSGIAEVSIYIEKSSRRKGVGKMLINRLVAESEKAGFWLLQSVIMEENLPSVKLHEKCGFRTVGVREKMARDWKGKWRTTVLMEKRSAAVGIE